MKVRKPRFEKQNIRWALVGYDAIVFALTVLFYYIGGTRFLRVKLEGFLTPSIIIFCFLLLSRIVFKIYKLIWRYGGVQTYMTLIFADFVAYVAFFIYDRLLGTGMAFIVYSAIFISDLLFALAMRMVYRYIYKFATDSTPLGKFLCGILKIFSFEAVEASRSNEANRILVAIVGAGSAGISLAEDMGMNNSSPYAIRCFIDIDRDKVGRIIRNVPVLSEEDTDQAALKRLEIQEVVFALPGVERETIKELYDKYTGMGYKVKTYDFPTLANAESGKRQLREFDIEDLLFRKQIVIDDERTSDFYKDKVILITGGGGSIGSELCRQLAKLSPKQLVLVDIYENGVYDVQQELRIKYGKELNLKIAIVSFTNRRGLERVFKKYRPQIVINAAAHKHVPLMEDDCIEAVENNVFGTLNTVELSEKYGVEKFIQISTDKAVNPTNVMGATKRMCEFILQAHSTADTGTKYSAVRFGNVLGSAGSVVPLFKRQISTGGPVTVTDKRIIRYFMTIPEASCLVLQSGAMAGNGELFVLDMGEPVKIYDLAESMIRLSGLTPGVDIEIRETGLRPGEKLYEELLIKSEHLSKTDNDLIFIEKDEPITMQQLEEKLQILQKACESDENETARDALLQVVPTFTHKEPEPYVEATLDAPDTYLAEEK